LRLERSGFLHGSAWRLGPVNYVVSMVFFVAVFGWSVGNFRCLRRARRELEASATLGDAQHNS
jgi:hypothetical protein